MGILIAIVGVISAIFLAKAVSGFFGLIFAVITWMLTGYVAGRLIRGSSYGLIGNVVMGLIGGIVGSSALGLVGAQWIASAPVIGPVIGGVIGAIITVLVVRTFVDEKFAS